MHMSQTQACLLCPNCDGAGTEEVLGVDGYELAICGCCQSLGTVDDDTEHDAGACRHSPIRWPRDVYGELPLETIRKRALARRGERAA